MIRIHAGKYKNRRIKRVDNETTRETASMVREAVFNMLYTVNGKVLDLFAGSGSYGITALSLGAEEAYFVDNNKKAFLTLKNNIKDLEIENNSKVHFADYETFLKSNTEKFDLVFLDPPYNYEKYLVLLNLLFLHIEENGRIVLEIDKKTRIDYSISGLALEKEKVYGIKRILIYRRANNNH